MDETYIKVRGRRMYLYHALDGVGDTVEFGLSEHRDLPTAKLFLRRALSRHGRPDRIVIDGSQTDREAIAGSDAPGFDADPRPKQKIPQQPRRSGSSPHQATGAADDGH